MEKKQAIIGIVMASVIVGLFVIIYTQFSGKTSPEPTAIVTEPGVPVAPSVPQNTSPSGANVPATAAETAPTPTVPTSIPVAQPETATDVANNISAQMDNESKAIDVESQAEASQAQSDSNTLNSIESAYDQAQN